MHLFGNGRPTGNFHLRVEKVACPGQVCRGLPEEPRQSVVMMESWWLGLKLA